MKGIVLAGKSGSKLYPITLAIPKQLLPIYNRPMIYFPIETLRNSGITDILVITTSDQQNVFKKYLGDGVSFNVSLSYAIQDNPRGIADAITIGANFLKNDDFCLITGDTIIIGDSLTDQITKAFRAAKLSGNATIFLSCDTDDNQYGKVINNLVVGDSDSQYYRSIMGLYVFPFDAVDKVKHVEISERGLLEITSLSKLFQNEAKLQMQKLSSDCQWLDTNSFDNILKCSQIVQSQVKNTHKL